MSTEPGSDYLEAARRFLMKIKGGCGGIAAQPDDLFAGGDDPESAAAIRAGFEGRVEDEPGTCASTVALVFSGWPVTIAARRSGVGRENP
jgi:hypothetical protein